MIIEYIGLAEKINGGYTVFVPGFPGLESDGKTLETARKNARNGLIAHIDFMLESHQTIPQTTSLDRVMALTEAKNCIPLSILVVAPPRTKQPFSGEI